MFGIVERGHDMLAVDVQELSRRYAKTRRAPEVLALDGVSLQVAEGEVHGLLGPNGAGKTTLIKIISTVLLPSAGMVRVLGHDVVQEPRAVRGLVGVVFGGERGLYTRVSARRNLHFWGALYGLRHGDLDQRSSALLERVGLADHADTPVETFSRGMKQRLHLARGLIHEPRVLFLDEPTSGMDPAAALEFRTLIRELQDEGRTILLATHDMGEAQALCRSVTLIDGGRVLLSDQISTASRILGVRECIDFELANDDLVARLREQPFVASVEPLGTRDGQWRAQPVAPEATRDVFGWLVERHVLSARRAEPSLQEVYLRLVGSRGLRV
jgi:ABC-2 type transport system ATP-binding protein